jgi:hypothetical protein
LSITTSTFARFTNLTTLVLDKQTSALVLPAAAFSTLTHLTNLYAATFQASCIMPISPVHFVSLQNHERVADRQRSQHVVQQPHQPNSPVCNDLVCAESMSLEVKY